MKIKTSSQLSLGDDEILKIANYFELLAEIEKIVEYQYKSDISKNSEIKQ